MLRLKSGRDGGLLQHNLLSEVLSKDADGEKRKTSREIGKTQLTSSAACYCQRCTFKDLKKCGHSTNFKKFK